MKKYLLVIASTIAAAVSMNASAAVVGVVNFEGSVINGTCEVATGFDNQTITLPQALPSDFSGANQPGNSATITPFQITLSGCDSSVLGSSVALMFDANPVPGFNDIIANTGDATGVGVRISDAGKALTFTGVDLDHTTTPVTMAGTDVVFNLNAQYYAIADTVTPGLVRATATFGIIYP